LPATSWFQWVTLATRVADTPRRQRVHAHLLMYVAVLWISLAAHEIAHCRMLDHLGDHTPIEEGRLTWLPHKHLSVWGSLLVPAALLLLTSGSFLVMWAKPVHYRPGSMTMREPFATILVKLAGPAADALIAAVAWVALALLPHDIPFLAWRTLVAVLEVNVVLFLFNMLPVPPLDGGAIWLLAPIPVRLREVGALIAAAALLTVVVGLPLVTAQNPFGEMAHHVVGSALDLAMDGRL